MSAPVEFSVWAPLPERVRIQVDGAVHDMRREDDGWWRAEVAASPESDYGFLLDDNGTPRPDPRSRQHYVGAMGALHLYTVDVRWTGDRGEGTTSYRSYGRDNTIVATGKRHDILASADRTSAGRYSFIRRASSRRPWNMPMSRKRRRPLGVERSVSSRGNVTCWLKGMSGY